VRWVSAEHAMRPRPSAVVWLLLAAAEVHGAATPPVDYKALLRSCREEVCLNGSHLEATLTQTRQTWHDITIVYSARSAVVVGDLGEGEVSSRDSKNSHWTVSGHVQVFTLEGHLSADRATVQIVNGRVTTVTAEGAPAQFERSPDTASPANLSPSAQAALEHAHGHAHEIVFDVDRSQLEFSGDAYFTAGCSEFSSEHVVYDMANQKIEGDPRDHSFVSGTYKSGTSGCGGPAAHKP
jgi:lipopolysaccharide transport protein LptA